MGNLLLRIFIAVTTLILILLAIGSLLPRDYLAESSITIQAPREDIFPYLSRLKSWPNWMRNWDSHYIPDLKIQYSGSETGVGAIQQWSEPRGMGKLWITASVDNQKIEYDSKFADFPIMNSVIELDEQDGRTRVLWSSSGRLPAGPFYGYTAAWFAGAFEREYDQSLAALKTLVEAKDAGGVK